MRTNIQTPQIHTHEGTVAPKLNAELMLRRSLMACLLWENEFYESGVTIAERIKQLIPRVDSKKLALMAIEARTKMNLRHAPLLVAREMARTPEHREFTALVLENIINRADELAEFLSIYWKEKKEPLAAQVKKGLAKAFQKFDEYSLAKYNRDGAIKLKDVLFLCHAKPKDEAQDNLWKKLIANELATPDTWEVAISACGNDSVMKKAEFERLLGTGKMFALAIIRNLRKMTEVGVRTDVIKAALGTMRTDKVLPFRFITAAKAAPQYEPELEQAMFRSASVLPKLKGKTAILVDISASMKAPLSTRYHNPYRNNSDAIQPTRLDAAYGVAMIAREMCEEVVVGSFSDNFTMIPPRRGFALRDAIDTSQQHGCTNLKKAILKFNEQDYNRIIVITDEQTQDGIAAPKGRGYCINVASNQNGIGYGQWIHIDGFSEAVLNYIREYEELEG